MAAFAIQFITLCIAFFVLTLLYRLVAAISPGVAKQKIMRKGFWTDVSYWFFIPLVGKWLTRGALIVVIGLLLFVTGRETNQQSILDGYGWVATQPGWLQVLQILLLSDFISYWVHRWFHGERLWKFHAIHHCSVELDWLSSVRLHPVNEVANRVITAVPLVLLGFSFKHIILLAPFFTFYAVTLHANVNWTYGPLRYVIASPVFHRWHHTKEGDALGKNYAGLFPIWDLLFGSFYMPRNELPKDFGVHEPLPETLPGQMLYPFRPSPVKEVSDTA